MSVRLMSLTCSAAPNVPFGPSTRMTRLHSTDGDRVGQVSVGGACTRIAIRLESLTWRMSGIEPDRAASQEEIQNSKPRTECAGRGPRPLKAIDTWRLSNGWPCIENTGQFIHRIRRVLSTRAGSIGGRREKTKRISKFVTTRRAVESGIARLKSAGPETALPPG
jgi:hypothetical protein